MQPLPKLIADHQPALEALFRQYGVERAYVFGSVAKGTDTEESDVDLLVKFDHMLKFDEYMGLKSNLKSLFKREVDLLTVDALENRFFIGELNRTGMRIYDK